MGAVKVYIWGIRYGFRAQEALFPERARLTDSQELNHYNETVKLFTEEKDYLFRTSRKDFFYITKSNSQTLYSLVIADHQDIAGRKSYLVFSLSVPAGKQVTQDITAILRQIRGLYKEKNRDYQIDRNQFTQGHIDEIIQHVTLVSGHQKHNANTVYLYDNDDLLSKEFGNYTGSDIYFIPENSNPELIEQLGFRTSKLIVTITPPPVGMPQQNGPGNSNTATKSPHLDEFKAEYHSLKNSANPNPARAIQLLNAHPELRPQLHSDILHELTEWSHKFEENIRSHKLNDINYLLKKASENNWNADIAQLEALKPYDDLLSPEQHQMVENWYRKYSSHLAQNLMIRANNLHNKLKRSSKSDVLNNVKSYEEEIKSLEHAVSSLPEGTSKTSLLGHDSYRYLVSNKWIPKKRPIGFVVAICLLVAGVGYGIYFGLSAASDKQANANADNDHDGIPNNADAEPNTLWLADASKYKLKDYISGDGTLDRTKVDNELCNCFKITDTSERAKIKCTDNAEYFVFEGKLWHYVNDKKKNGFFDKDNLYVPNDSKTPICLHYEELIAESKTVIPEPTVSNSNDYITINHKGKKYTVPKNLTSANGIVFNGADYRFYNNKWETRALSGSGTWKTPKETDINFVLLKVGKVVAPKINDPKGGKQTGGDIPDIGGGKNIPEVSKDQNKADEFFLYYFDRGDLNFPDKRKMDMDKVNFIQPRINETPNTYKGKEAKRIIKEILKL